jgi:polysaccharide biosynthesis protein PslH
MKILFLSRWFPYPVDNGSKIRVFNLLKYLTQSHEIDLISFAGPDLQDSHLQKMKTYCRKVEAVPYRSFQPQRLTALAGFFSVEPRSVQDTYNPELQARVNRAMNEDSYDVVIASQVDMAPYALNHDNVVKILEEIELTTLYEQSMQPANPVEKARRSLMWLKWARYAGQMIRGFDGCTVVSEAEKQRVLEATGVNASIRVIPNGVDVANLSGDFGTPEEDTLVFTGALTYRPNFDAMEYFIRDIFPLIQEKHPAVSLKITGRLDGVRVDSLSRRGIIFTGFIDDIRPVVAGSWVQVVPIRAGGGTRLKVLESLALRTPVISTSKGVEGLSLTAGSDYMLGDTPDAFAQAVILLLENEDLRKELSVNGQKSVAAAYDWNNIGPRFCEFVEETVGMKLRVG